MDTASQTAKGDNKDQDGHESLCESQITNVWTDEAIRQRQMFLPSVTVEQSCLVVFNRQPISQPENRMF